MSLASRTERNRTISCMTDPTLGSSNNKVILNRLVPAALEPLQDLLEQAQLQINDLTTNDTANGRKVYSCSTAFIKNDAYFRPA